MTNANLFLWVACIFFAFAVASTHNNSECNPTSGTWQRQTNQPPFFNLSCPLEWSKYSCAYQEKPYSEEIAHFQFHSDCGWVTPTEMVRRAKGRPIFFIGDSLARQQFISLACFTWDFVSGTDVKWGREWPCHAQPRCIHGGEHSGFGRGCFTWRGGSEVCYSIQSLDTVLN